MSALDDRERYRRLDLSGMRDLVAALPEQAREAWAMGREWELPLSFRTPRRVVVCGVGGSAIGADVVATMAAQQSTVPVEIRRGYTAPVTDKETLVVACSFSGKTEETLAAFQGTLDGPGMRLAICTGGRLARIAEELDVPVFGYSWDGPPRTAFAYGVLPLLAILERMGTLPIEQDEVERALAGLDAAAAEWGVDTPERSNLAKQLASRLGDRVPVIVGADFLDVAARRWAEAVNENAKRWAFHAALPQAHHNFIAALGAPRAARDLLHVVLLDSPSVYERNRLRVRLTARALYDAGIGYDEVSVGGESMLEAVLRGCYLGDWVSLYLAMLGEVDPMPVDGIDAMKAMLAARE